MSNVKNFAVASNIELEEQIKEFVNCFAYKDSKIRIMPDGHAGKGAVVGSTITYDNYIVPNTVGVDIACRVSLFKMPGNVNLEHLDQIIHNKVPCGFSVRPIEHNYSKTFPYEDLRCWEFLENQNRLRLSMGSLGAGNHYISVDEDTTTGQLYLCIHTGSRNLGKQVCEYYQNLAVQHNKNYINDVHLIYERLIREARNDNDIDKIQDLLNHRNTLIKNHQSAKGLEYLVGNDMSDYLHDMIIINEWSYWNHMVITSSIMEELDYYPKLYWSCIHNYVDVKNKIIRKGAISANKGELGIIPLNMRDGVLIVRGKGNKDWNYSLPHGAGRLIPRGEARRSLSMEDFKNAMEDVYTTCVEESTLDESPMAYKDSKAIIKAIKPNAEIVAHLKEIYNFKATN